MFVERERRRLVCDMAFLLCLTFAPPGCPCQELNIPKRSTGDSPRKTRRAQGRGTVLPRSNRRTVQRIASERLAEE